MIVEIRVKLSGWYFIELQCLNPLGKPVLNVTETLDIQKMSLIVIDSKADLAPVRVFG